MPGGDRLELAANKCLKWAPPAVARESRLYWPGLSAIAWKTALSFGCDLTILLG